VGRGLTDKQLSDGTADRESEDVVEDRWMFFVESQGARDFATGGA
jgi:hypothetical protein